MSKNKITIEKLATIIAKGFENTATKDDITRIEEKMATKDDLADLERKLSAKIEAIDEKTDTLEEVDVRDLQKRVYVLEKDVKHLKHKHA